MKLSPYVVLFSLLVGTPTARAQPASPAPAGGKDLITSPQSVTVQSTDISSDKVEMWSTDTETRGIFSGNVIVIGNNLRLTCDRLEIIATSIGDKTVTVGTLEKFKYLLASGKVRIVQGDREATCGRAEVFPRENKIIMTENPMVVDHGSESTYVGSQLRLFRGQRRVEGDDVKMTFPPIKDLGFDKNEPAPKAEDIRPAPVSTPPASGEPAKTPQPPAHK